MVAVDLYMLMVVYSSLVLSYRLPILSFYLSFFFLMIRRPPRSTRTDTLFPYTTLFRSGIGHIFALRGMSVICSNIHLSRSGDMRWGSISAILRTCSGTPAPPRNRCPRACRSQSDRAAARGSVALQSARADHFPPYHCGYGDRTEARRVGKECVSA